MKRRSRSRVRKLDVGSLVVVYWEDACGADAVTWVPSDEPYLWETKPMMSVGWFLGEQNNRVVIAANMDLEEGRVSGFIAVPTGWVTDCTVLNLPK